MRKAFAVVCLAAILASIAGTAAASVSYWVVKIRTCNPGSPASTITIGARPDPGNPFGSQSFMPDRPNVALNIPPYQTGQFLDSDNPPPYEFPITIGVAQNYPYQMVYVSAWTPENYLGESGRALPSNYMVTVYKGFDIIASWNYSELYVGITEPGTVQVGPVGFWYTYDSKVSSFAASTDDFVVMVYAIPEPAGLVSLAAGSLSALGFVLRRRKA